MGKYLDEERIVALYDALDAGMSQRKVAALIGCSVSVVNDWKQKRDKGEAPEQRVLSWDSVTDRCDAAWGLCRQTESVDERMDLLSAALWPQEAPHFEQQYDLIDSLPDHKEYDGANETH